MIKTMTQTTKNFWFTIQNTFGNGTIINNYTLPPQEYNNDNINFNEEEPDYAPEEACEITVTLPTTFDYRLHIINEYPEYNVVWSKDFNKEDNPNYHQTYMKIFSQINNHLPFVITGHTSSYKDKGYYPTIPKEILEIPNINKIEEIIKNNFDGYYFAFVVDSKGNEVLTEPICPN